MYSAECGEVKLQNFEMLFDEQQQQRCGSLIIRKLLNYSCKLCESLSTCNSYFPEKLLLYVDDWMVVMTIGV